MDISAIAATQTELAARQASPIQESSFDKEGFLNLLVAQLKYQDPLEPMSNEQFMQQMTQFSMLEELQNMGSAFGNYTQSNIITSGATLVGKEATLETLTGENVTGIVEKVRLVGDELEIYVNGEWHDMTELVGVAETQTETGTGTGSDAGTDTSSTL